MSLPMIAFILVMGVASAIGCREKLDATSRKDNRQAGLPRIELSGTERDLGDVPVDRDHPFTTTFRLRNSGNAELRVTRIEQSCQCAQVRVNPLVLPAGAEGEVRLELKRLVPQRNQATVTLHTNDANTGSVQINVKWRASAPVEFEPYSLDFGSVLPDSTIEQDVAVVARAHDEVAAECEIGSVDCRPPTMLNAHWRESAPEKLPVGESRSMRIVLHAGSDLGEQHGQVVLPIPNSTFGELSLPVRWRVHDLVEASPKSLFLGSGKRDAILAKTLTISTTGDEALELAEVRVVPPEMGLSAKISKSGEKSALISVEAELPRSSGRQSWQIAIECVRPVARTINVPVTAYTVDPLEVDDN